MNALDLAGERFGSLTALEPARSNELNSNGKPRTAWLCHCDCGNEVVVTTQKLRYGRKTSCGCMTFKSNGEQRKHVEFHGDSRGVGRSKSRLYSIWCAMMRRTGHHAGNAEKDQRRYVDRGINVCEEWQNSYVAFRDWALSHGYKSNLSLDRINNNDSYYPGNCRWATAKEQYLNRECVKASCL